MQHTQQSTWEKEENSTPNAKGLQSLTPRFCLIMQKTFPFLDPFGASEAVNFPLHRTVQVTWPSGMLCNWRMVLWQCFWKTLSFLVSFLHKSLTLPINLLKWLHAFLTHHPWCFSPSLVRVHLASHFAARCPEHGIWFLQLKKNLTSTQIEAKIYKVWFCTCPCFQPEIAWLPPTGHHRCSHNFVDAFDWDFSRQKTHKSNNSLKGYLQLTW